MSSQHTTEEIIYQQNAPVQIVEDVEPTQIQLPTQNKLDANEILLEPKYTKNAKDLYSGQMSYSSIVGPRRRRLDMNSASIPIQVFLPDSRGTSALSIIPQRDDKIYESMYGDKGTEPLYMYFRTGKELRSHRRVIISLIILIFLILASIVLSIYILVSTSKYSATIHDYDIFNVLISICAGIMVMLLWYFPSRGLTVILIATIITDMLVNLVRAYTTEQCILCVIQLFICVGIRETLISNYPQWSKLKK